MAGARQNMRVRIPSIYIYIQTAVGPPVGLAPALPNYAVLH